MPMVENGHKVKIELSPVHGTRVWIDGSPVQGIVCVETRHHVGEVSRVKLELLPSGIEIVGDAGEVDKLDASREDVHRLGTDQMLRAALEGLKKRNAATEGQ